MIDGRDAARLTACADRLALSQGCIVRLETSAGRLGLQEERGLLSSTRLKPGLEVKEKSRGAKRG